MPSLDNSSTKEIVLDESSNENYTTSLHPISASPLSFQEVEEEARELAKVIRRMHAADKRYWEESEFQTLFQDNKLTISQGKVDHFQAKLTDTHSQFLYKPKGDAEGCEAKGPCFEERKVDEEERRIVVVNNEVDPKAIVEKWRGTINGFQEHNQTTPPSLDVQIIEDRIDKARSDLNFLEQQTTQMEIEMKTLQMELAKLKDQLCQTRIQYDE